MEDQVLKVFKMLQKLVNSNELDNAIKEESLSGDHAFSDDGLESLETQLGSLLTPDAVMNNADIEKKFGEKLYSKHKADIMHKFEKTLTPVYDLLGIDYKDSEFISDKLEEVPDAFTLAISNSDNKSTLEALKKQVEDVSKASETEISEALETSSTLVVLMF